MTTIYNIIKCDDLGYCKPSAAKGSWDRMGYKEGQQMIQTQKAFNQSRYGQVESWPEVYKEREFQAAIYSFALLYWMSIIKQLEQNPSHESNF